MSAFFGDSSALVKRYVAEIGTAWLTTTIDPKGGNLVFVARITFVEVISAITRKERGGHLSAIDAATARNQFEADYLGEFFAVEITETLIQDAAKLAQKYALRGYDAVQLAAAIETENERLTLGLSPLTLLSADNDLNAAATAEGLLVENPNNHP